VWFISVKLFIKGCFAACFMQLKVIGDGGNPDGHDTDDEGHHH
jgi:hypothetical protein